MSSRPFSFSPLIIAIAIHLLILAMVVLGLYVSTKKHRHIQEPRILLSLKNSVVSNQNIPSIESAQNSPVLERKATPSLSKTTDAETVLHDVTPIQPIVLSGKMEGLIKRHYGDVFYDLTPGEQAFIITNIQKIRRINYVIGNALLADKPQDKLLDLDNNYVEFYLHPDGTVSDITLVNERQGSLLDELIVETIEHAYSQYPRPKQTTFIRLRSWIIRTDAEFEAQNHL